MLLTEYDEQKTQKAIYYEGQRDGIILGHRDSLRMLYDLVASGDLSMAVGVRKAAAYDVADEADFRRHAAEQGIQLPE